MGQHEPEGFCLLFRSEGRGATETDSLGLSASAAFSGSLSYERPFEFRNTGQHRHNHSAVRCRCIGPGLSQRPEGRALCRDGFRQCQHVEGGARKPIKTGDQDQVAFLQTIEDEGELRAVAARAGYLLREEKICARLQQGLFLSL